MFLYINRSVRLVALPILFVWIGVATMHTALAQTNAPPLSHTSAFDLYPDNGEVTPIDWRAANVVVGQRGGWRAYAAEASEAAKRASQGGAQ
ncbi:hypothetical protein LN050_08695 [Comamonadaceae bacterium M7527]|nr:hypothetical protein LN050_08695 [Comamonadaceae bacterium M7527]